MNQKRGFWLSLFFALVRLSPIFTPALIVSALPLTMEEATILVQQLLVVAITLAAWNMTEGIAVLWIEAKTKASDSAKGYLLATMIAAAMTLGVMQYLRFLTTQGIFLLLLGTLSLRGMSRSGWENQRSKIGFVGAILGNSLLAFISLLLLTRGVYWQSFICSVALGCSVASVEAGWYQNSFSPERDYRWAAPTFRVVTCIGPILVATLAMINEIPRVYAISFLLLLFVAPSFRKMSTGSVMPERSLRSVSCMFLAFVAILAACRAFQSESLW